VCLTARESCPTFAPTADVNLDRPVRRVARNFQMTAQRTSIAATSNLHIEKELDYAFQNSWKLDIGVVARRSDDCRCGGTQREANGSARSSRFKISAGNRFPRLREKRKHEPLWRSHESKSRGVHLLV